MTFETNNTKYPPIKTGRITMNLLRQWIFRGFFGAFLICALVNLCVGGKPWIILVALGEYIFYAAFLSKEAIESMYLERLTSILYGVCAILLVTGWWGSGGMEVALPMTYFGMLCISFFVCVIEYRRQRKNLIPIINIFFTSIINALIGLFMPWGLNWPRIVLLSTSAFLILVSLLLFRKIIFIELKKRFSVK